GRGSCRAENAEKFRLTRMFALPSGKNFLAHWEGEAPAEPKMQKNFGSLGSSPSQTGKIFRLTRMFALPNGKIFLAH
ncbi:MAG: hypothetical protein ACK40X_14380, partial [Armatimonadota bacterium]